MASLLERLTSGKRSISSLEDYVQALNQFVYNGHAYDLGGVQQTLSGEKVERISNSLESFAKSAYASNGIVFAVMAVRQLVFSAVRFQFQGFNAGRPGNLFGSPALTPLEEPWPGGTTQDLLSRMINDADLAGNWYAIEDTSFARLGVETEIVRLRPDWVDIALAPRMIRQEDGEFAHVGFRKSGVVYWEGGRQSGAKPAVFLPNEVAHFAPHPDPLANYRGMSWLTPIIREIQTDGQMTNHKRRFLENGATPNMVVKGIQAATKEQFDQVVDMMEARHQGPANAGKMMFLVQGVDATVVGTDFKSLDLKSVQGAGETRIASAGGVPAVIVGLSEGMQGSSLNAGNYGQARRRLADGTMHPLWQNAAGSLQPIVTRPDGTRLWYDARDVPFLREDEKDAAEIQLTKSSTIAQYVREGFTPESAVAAVEAQDLTLLVHTGRMSIQLQSPDSGEDDGVAARNLVEMIQKVYLGVGTVLTADEAREILNRGGANLPLPAPDLEPGSTDDV